MTKLQASQPDSKPKSPRRRVATVLALILSAGAVTLAAAPSASATYYYGNDSATTRVWCDAVGHQVWVQSTATYYTRSTTRDILVSRNGGPWTSLDGVRIPDNSVQSYN